MGKSKILWIFAVLGVVMSIASPASAASVSLKNDLKYSQAPEAFILRITHIKHADGQNEFSRRRIWPGETIKVSRHNIVSFEIEHPVGRNRVDVYVVQCPAKEMVTVSLSFSRQIKGSKDLPEGFSVRKGRWTRERGMQWFDRNQ